MINKIEPTLLKRVQTLKEDQLLECVLYANKYKDLSKQLKDNFTAKDYNDLNVVNSLNDYKVGYSDGKWYLHNTTTQKSVKYPCDRISLMYEQK